jgi:XRE family transcriptional regulator, regulator of sulfur utilization
MWNDIVMPNARDAITSAELARLIGERVRGLRVARGWSLSSLAVRAHLGKATLSQIESGNRNPTIETLYAIAAQLQIGLSELLTESGAAPAAAPTVKGKAVEATLVAAYDDAAFTTEIYRLRIRPGRTQVSPGHGPGVVEHLLVTAGAIRVGPVEQPSEVSAGADLIWEPTGPHSYAAVGDDQAEAVLVMRHPRVRL